MKLEALRLQIGSQERRFYIRRDSSDISVFSQVFVDLAYDLANLDQFRNIQQFLEAGRKRGKRPLIIDAGANIGATAVYFSMQCQDAVVVAIEPDAGNFQLLTSNTCGLAVVPLLCAIGSNHDNARVVDVGKGFWALRTESVPAGDDDDDVVNSTTVNEIVSAYERDCFPFIIKIDIEGGERGLFQDQTQWLSRTPVLMLEPHDWLLPGQGTALPFLRAIAPLNRDFLIRGENIFSIAHNLCELLP